MDIRLRNCGVLDNLVQLLKNILLVYILYTLCRLCFLWTNAELYTHLSFGQIMHLLGSGLVFDSSAICYANAIIVLMFLFPLHVKEQKNYYTVAKWIFVVVNGLCLCANLADAVYFPFTGRRTTMNVFQEFHNEGTWNIVKIFAVEAIRHWPLLLAALAMIAALWWGFSAPCYRPERRAKRLVRYYAVNLVMLGACAYLCVGLMRGGFTHAVRPITISNANQYVNNPAEAGVVLNTPFSMLRTIGKKAFVDPNYMSVAEAETLYSPLHAMTDTAEFRDMNVVVIILESFSQQHIGFYQGREMFTPFLDSLLRTDALTYKYSFANGRKSIDGMPSVLSSIPSFVEPFFLTPAAMNHISGLARELSENKGYESAFFHGAENGSMGFEAFARASGFQKYYGRTEYNQDPNYGGDDDYDGMWAIWDEEFLQYFADRMSEMPQPFMTAVFTATSHHPFAVPERYKGVFPQGDVPLQQCIAYTDNALRLFFEKASRQPWFDNTIFVITADHIGQGVDPYYLTVLGRYTVPVIFYSPKLGLKGYDTDTVVQQIDIMPTVLGILGYDKEFVAFGQDILHTPADEKWAVHWVPEFQGYEFVKGEYLVRFDGKEVFAVYNYRQDPMQTTDLSSSIDPEQLRILTAELQSIIQQYMQRMISDNLK